MGGNQDRSRRHFGNVRQRASGRWQARYRHRGVVVLRADDLRHAGAARDWLTQQTPRSSERPLDAAGEGCGPGRRADPARLRGRLAGRARPGADHPRPLRAAAARPRLSPFGDVPVPEITAGRGAHLARRPRQPDRADRPGARLRRCCARHGDRGRRRADRREPVPGARRRPRQDAKRMRPATLDELAVIVAQDTRAVPADGAAGGVVLAAVR